MAEKNDIVAKNFEAFPDVAADILNALLYEGRKEIGEGELIPAPTESVYQGKEGLRNQYEDVGKYEIQNGEKKALYLFANQTTVDGKMFLRKAGYVGGAYREQYDGKVPDACPVVEIVLYWGKERWGGIRDLKKFFHKKGLPAEFWDYADDIKLHVWEMRYLPEHVRKRFTSDMRIVADYLAEGKSYRSDQKVVHKEALIKMIRVLSGDKNVEDTTEFLKEANIKEEDEIMVCELFDQYIRQGKKEGKKEGCAETLVKNVENLAGTIGTTIDEACRLVGASPEEYTSAKKLLG